MSLRHKVFYHLRIYTFGGGRDFRLNIFLSCEDRDLRREVKSDVELTELQWGIFEGKLRRSVGTPVGYIRRRGTEVGRRANGTPVPYYA